MSKSRKTESRKKYPVELYLRWKAKEKKVEVKNSKTKKSAKVTKVSMIPIEILYTATGKNGEEYYRASMVRDSRSENIKVWLGNKLVGEGLYRDLKVSCPNIKFGVVVFGVMETKDGPKLAQIVLDQATSRGSWFDFSSSKNHYDGSEPVDINDFNYGLTISNKGYEMTAQTGDKFNCPLFETFQPTDEQDEEALKLDETLQKYLDFSTSKRESHDGEVGGQPTDEQDEEVEVVEDEQTEDAQDISDLPF